MLGYLKRLVTTGAAYQFGDILAKGIALVTLPLYTRHVSAGRLRRGQLAADGRDPGEHPAAARRRRGVHPLLLRGRGRRAPRRGSRARPRRPSRGRRRSPRSSAVAFAGPLSRLILGFRDPLLIDCAILGLWAFTNLEMAYAQLRVDERTRTYVFASGANVAMTVTFTVALVVFADQGARGLLLGNFGASAIVVLGLWWVLRRRVSLRVRLGDLGAMLRFGLPTVPADASVYALQVVDRFYLFRGYSARGRRRLRGRAAVRDGRVRRRARLPVRVAAARLLDRLRRAGRAAVRARDDLLRARDRAWSWRRRAARRAGSCACSPRHQYFGAHTRAALAGARRGRCTASTR